MNLQIQHFFDKGTSTLTYVVFDKDTSDAVVIDPVWDFDLSTGKLSTESMDAVVGFLQKNNLNPHFVLETHAHADHLSSSQLFKKIFPNIKVAIGTSIMAVQKIFGSVFNAQDIKPEGKDFDRLLNEGEILSAGSLQFKVLSTPGHTPACCSYLVEDALFSGDAIFFPDGGTGRCDFPGGSAADLYNSIKNKIYALPENTRIFVGHDYQPNGRELKFQTTVLEEKSKNIHLRHETPAEEYIKMRTERDKTLTAPKLLLPSMQVNIKAGHLPATESNSKIYLKIPLKKTN